MNQDLIKKFGEGAFITGDQLKEQANPTLHVSPKLDLILGGGIPGGSVVTLTGDPKCGKTVTCLHIAAKGQAQGRPVHYLNVEGRLKTRDLDGIRGLDQSKFNIVRSYRLPDGSTRILTAEEFLQTAETICHTVPGAIVIIDSISQLMTSGEFTKDIGDKSRAPGAVLIAQLTRKLANVIPVNDVILLCIVHFIANTSGFGKAKVSSGGNKIKYACDIGLECKKFTFIREGGGEDTEEGVENVKKPIGQKVTWVTTSTAFAPPGQVTDSIIKYGIGIDEMTELVQLAIEFGFIARSGAWFKLVYLADSMPDIYKADEGKKKGSLPNIQGESNLVDWLSAHPEEYKELEKAMQEMLQQ